MTFIPAVFTQVSDETPMVLALRQRIFAIATFDANGILERCALGKERNNPVWTEVIFSAIGLKGLLDASLEHQPFHHAKIDGGHQVALLIRRRRRYVAALMARPASSAEEEAMCRYLQETRLGDLFALVEPEPTLMAG